MLAKGFACPANEGGHIYEPDGDGRQRCVHCTRVVFYDPKTREWKPLR
jgi:hypothetical protein